MKLHIIRHAKTNQASSTGRDFDRELLPRGKRQCHTLAQHLRNQGLERVQIFCSSAVRTLQTWEGIERSAVEPISWEKSSNWYLCDYRTWLDKLWSVDRGEDILLIGHNFGISDLLSYLSGDNIILKTSEYIVLEFPFDHWSEISQETATIVHRFRPEDL